ncbi:VOC family protein [Actinomycetospora cinnamomea]|uniref:VOC family protein n=1 Tax=Actinomycetospora cinnamomea TaxID=663609 RepID=UPI0014023D00|nr:VOC family protein [Actinomycetospora cinnamomea]
MGLPVRDAERSVAFYASHFGFDPATATTHDDGTVIVRNRDAFDLALHPDAGVAAPLHPFLHVGFRLTDADAVRAVLADLRAAGAEIVEEWDEPGYVALKCADPDGHRVEVYWEP